MRQLFTLLFLILLSQSSSSIHAQTKVICGAVVESEFTHESEVHIYKIDLEPGDKLNASMTFVGDELQASLGLFDPNNREIARTLRGGSFSGWIFVDPSPALETSVLSARGTYSLVVGNNAIQVNALVVARDSSWSGGTGLYTLNVGCTKRNGDVIKPGDIISTTDGGNDNSTTASVGLPLPKLEGSINLPLTLAQPVIVAVAPSIVYSSLLDAKAGEKYLVDITRQSGTAPLGLTVYDPASTPIFALAMGSSTTFSTTIEITVDGEHKLAFALAPLNGANANAAAVYQVTVTKQ